MRRIKSSIGMVPLLLILVSAAFAFGASTVASADEHLCRPIPNACKNYMRACAAGTETPHKCHRCGYPPIYFAGAFCVGPMAPCEPFIDPEPACGLEEQADCVFSENGFELCTNWTSTGLYCGRLFCR